MCLSVQIAGIFELDKSDILRSREWDNLHEQNTTILRPTESHLEQPAAAAAAAAAVAAVLSAPAADLDLAHDVCAAYLST